MSTGVCLWVCGSDAGTPHDLVRLQIIIVQLAHAGPSTHDKDSTRQGELREKSYRSLRTHHFLSNGVMRIPLYAEPRSARFLLARGPAETSYLSLALDNGNM